MAPERPTRSGNHGQPAVTISSRRPVALVCSRLLSLGFHMQTHFLGYLCSFGRGISHQKQIQMNAPPHITGFPFNTVKTKEADL